MINSNDHEFDAPIRNRIRVYRVGLVYFEQLRNDGVISATNEEH